MFSQPVIEKSVAIHMLMAPIGDISWAIGWRGRKNLRGIRFWRTMMDYIQVKTRSLPVSSMSSEDMEIVRNLDSEAADQRWTFDASPPLVWGCWYWTRERGWTSLTRLELLSHTYMHRGSTHWQAAQRVTCIITASFFNLNLEYYNLHNHTKDFKMVNLTP